MKICRLSVLLMCSLLLAGCASYYAVKDSATGKTYYTNEIEEATGGALKLIDAKSSLVIIIQSFEVRKIDRDEFSSALTAQPEQKIKPVKIRSKDEITY